MSKTIVLCTISLHKVAGGLERNFISLANTLQSKGYSVKVITFDLPNAQSFYKLNKKIHWICVGNSIPHQRISFFDRISQITKIRKVFRECGDVVCIGFHHGVLPRLTIASIRLPVTLICSERNSLSLYKHITKKKYYSLGFYFLIFCKKIIVQMEEYVLDYPSFLRKKIIKIPNVVVGPKDPHVSVDEKVSSRYKIISIGRLCSQKNFAHLIESFAQISHKFMDWDLLILGEGDQEIELQALIQKFGLKNRINIVRNTHDIFEVYAQSNIFCSTSQWEGFPNALAEAMAFGLPAVGLQDCAGVNLMIQDGFSGILTSSKDLPAALTKLMSNPHLRTKMGENAKSYVSQFSPKSIYDLWENTINNINS